MKKENIDEKELQNEAEEQVSDVENQEETVEETEADQEASEEEDSEEEEETSEVDELAEAKDKYLRLYSEFENYRRRTAKEKLDMIQTAGEKILVELLPIIDDFGRAISSNDGQEKEAVVEGMNLISTKFQKVLEGQGLKLMDTEPGTEFDPELHEAVTQIPAPDKKLKGKIVDTIEQGYFLGDKVIRYAKVVTGA